MIRLVFLGFLAVAYVQSRVGDVCTDISQCDPGECCQILSRFMVVSKRQLVDPIAQADSGTCQLYHKENESCSGFEHINGYCGCGPGLECYMYEVPIEGVQVAPGRRSMVAPRPGYIWRSECWSLDRIPQA